MTFFSYMAASAYCHNAVLALQQPCIWCLRPGACFVQMNICIAGTDLRVAFGFLMPICVLL